MAATVAAAALPVERISGGRPAAPPPSLPLAALVLAARALAVRAADGWGWVLRWAAATSAVVLGLAGLPLVAGLLLAQALAIQVLFYTRW